MYDDGDHRMPEDADDEELDTAHKFVDIVNNEDWEGEKTWQYKVVENSAFLVIMVALGCGMAAAIGGVIWVWKQIL